MQQKIFNISCKCNLDWTKYRGEEAAQLDAFHLLFQLLCNLNKLLLPIASPWNLQLPKLPCLTRISQGGRGRQTEEKRMQSSLPIPPQGHVVLVLEPRQDLLEVLFLGNHIESFMLNLEFRVEPAIVGGLLVWYAPRPCGCNCHTPTGVSPDLPMLQLTLLLIPPHVATYFTTYIYYHLIPTNIISTPCLVQVPVGGAVSAPSQISQPTLRSQLGNQTNPPLAHLVQPSQFHSPVAKQLGMFSPQVELFLAQCHKGTHLVTKAVKKSHSNRKISVLTLLGTRL